MEQMKVCNVRKMVLTFLMLHAVCLRVDHVLNCLNITSHMKKCVH